MVNRTTCFPGFPGCAAEYQEGGTHPPTPRWAGWAGQPHWGGSGGPTARPRCGAATEEMGMHHQDSQQACNASTHHTIQDTSLQWHSTLGLDPHLIGPTAGGQIYQSPIAGKCTNNVTGTTKLNETTRTASKTAAAAANIGGGGGGHPPTPAGPAPGPGQGRRPKMSGKCTRPRPDPPGAASWRS
eukprot:gene15978-biopygen12774